MRKVRLEPCMQQRIHGGLDCCLYVLQSVFTTVGRTDIDSLFLPWT